MRGSDQQKCKTLGPQDPESLYPATLWIIPEACPRFGAEDAAPDGTEDATQPAKAEVEEGAPGVE